jgi:hypothetical protein
MLHFKNANQSIPISPVRDIGDAIYWERQLRSGVADSVELIRK